MTPFIDNLLYSLLQFLMIVLFTVPWNGSTQGEYSSLGIEEWQPVAKYCLPHVGVLSYAFVDIHPKS